MLRKALALCLGGALFIGGAHPARAQAPVTDPDVLKGIRMVDDGDYDAAIVLLDTAARRLSADPSKVRDLSQAYLHLGIAYVGKGHEAAAKAKFREAVAGIKDLTLSAEKYPPKVINLFEAARDEARAATAPPGPSAPPAAASTRPVQPAPKGGGGGKKVLLIVGGLAVVGGGAAVALGGGGDGGADASSGGFTQSLERSESVAEGEAKYYKVTPSKAGTMEAQLRWTNRDVRLTIGCQEEVPPNTVCSGQYVRTSDTTGTLTTPVQQKEYLLAVENYSSGQPGVVTFTFTVRYP